MLHNFDDSYKTPFLIFHRLILAVFLANTKAIDSTELNSGLQDGFVFSEQFLECVIRPFVNIINFEIDIAAGHMTGIFSLFGLVSFLILLNQINQIPNTSHVNHKTAFGKGYAVCTGF